MANKHKSFFLLTVNALCLLCYNATRISEVGGRERRECFFSSHYCMFHIFRQLWSEHSSSSSTQSVLRYLRQYIMRTAFVLWRRDWNHLICASGFWACCTRTGETQPDTFPFSVKSPWQRQPLSANCGGWRRTWNLKKAPLSLSLSLSLLPPPPLPPWPASPLTSYAPSRTSHQRNASQKRPSPVVERPH